MSMVVNETIGITSTLQPVVNSTMSRFTELVTAPYHHVNLLWITIPLIISLLLMDIYFGRYKKEKLGWNTAVGNSLALTFVTMDLFRQIWLRLEEPSIWNLFFANFGDTLVILVLALGSLWLLFANFLHALPRKLAFFISSTLPTSVFAYLGIILVYTDIPIDKYTLLDSLVFFVVLLIILEILQFLLIHLLHIKSNKKVKFVYN